MINLFSSSQHVTTGMTEQIYKATPLKIALLLILFVQDVVSTYKEPIAICAPVFYTLCFLVFLFIFSAYCNVYLDVITLVYNFFLFITSCFTHNEYETIHETKNKKQHQRTNDDYPDVEIRRFTKKNHIQFIIKQ